MAASTPPDTRELDLTGDLGDALLAVAATLEAAFILWESDARSPRAYRLRASALTLAGRLVARARRAVNAPTDAELRVAAFQQMEDAAGALGALESELPTTVDEVDTDLLWRVSELMDEAALEYHDHEARLAFREPEAEPAEDEDAEMEPETVVLQCAPLGPLETRRRLLGLMFGYLQHVVDGDPLLALESDAGAWWLDRWRATPVADDDFAAIFREEEWSLAEQPRLPEGESLLQSLLGTGVLDELPPRQRQLAERMSRSVAGVWRVGEWSGDEVVYRWPLNDTEFRVREDAGVQYPAGGVAIGRLIPLDDGEWMRSPGMLVLEEPVEGWVEIMAEPFRAAVANRHPGAPIVEGVLTRTFFTESLPRRVPPARSGSEARTVLAESLAILRERGAVRPPDMDVLPPAFVSHLQPGENPAVEYVLTPYVSEWLIALGEMGRKGTGGSKSKAKKRRR